MLDGPPENDNGHLSVTAEAFSNTTPSLGGAAAPLHNSTEPLGKASENAIIAANLEPPDGSPDMRTHALEYANWPGFSPIPLHAYDVDLTARGTKPGADKKTVRDAKANGKRPIGMAWYENASAERAKVHQRFSDTLTGLPLDCNIGIANGKLLPNGKRLLIIDLDTKKSNKAEAATFVERYKELNAAVGPLPKTVTSRSATPGKHRGGHLYLQVPAETTIAFRGVIPGVDCTAQVVAPGSVIDGRAYEWEPGYSPWETEIADAPQKLIDKLTAAPASTRALDAASGSRMGLR
jgi:Bifunctional DNA primase/polymerase, N-terminal